LRTRSGASALVIVVVVALAAAAGLVPADAGPPGPAWPAAVAPIAAFVSRDRGLAFKHTVPVHLLSPEVFDARIAAQDVPGGAAQGADDRRTAAELRSLGLLSGSVDLVHAESAADSGTVLGYYDSTTKALYVRGRDLTPEVRVTIAHELTHALQDQYFGLNRLDDAATTTGAQSALDALEEGDAVLDEGDYLNSLPLAQQRQDSAEESGPSGPASGPGIVEVDDNVPYVLGPDLVGAIYAAGGNRAIDTAFRNPPTTELDVLDPVDYLRHVPTTSLATPRLAAGERRVGSPSDFGALTLYVTLASRIDPTSALGTADGWGGGSMVQYQAGGRTCTAVSVTGRSGPATAAIARALAEWAGTMPAGQVALASPGRSAGFSTCDPGAGATAGPRSLDDALNLADSRNQNEVNAIYAGAPIAIAGCVGDDSLADRALLKAEAAQDAVVGPAPAGLQDTIDRQTARLIERCEPKTRG